MLTFSKKLLKFEVLILGMLDEDRKLFIYIQEGLLAGCWKSTSVQRVR